MITHPPLFEFSVSFIVVLMYQWKNVKNVRFTANYAT